MIIMMDKMNKVAIIDNSIFPHIYNPAAHWCRHLGGTGYGFRAKDRQLPGLQQGFTHFILTGSEASIMERERWVEHEMEFVREITAGGYPILGSCYGHQLLALALAGPSHVRRSPEPELGWYTIDILSDNELLGKKGCFSAYTLHFDEVIDLAPPFRVLASTPGCPVHVFQYGSSPVWGIQAHPEIDIPTGVKLFQDMLDIRSQSEALYRKALQSKPNDSGKIYQIVDVFLKKRRLINMSSGEI